MSARVVLVRHGTTQWSENGRHTSFTELPLLDASLAAARALAPRLAQLSFARVLTSPLGRARRTAELGGFPDAELDDDLQEWNYGAYEGVTTAEIRRSHPGWTVWSGECPGGESADEVGARMDRVIARALRADGDTLVFGHGHSLRVLTARWLGQPATSGRLYSLATGTISLLGWEREQAVIVEWNT